MKKFKTYLLAAIGLVILVGALVLLTPIAGQGQRGGGPPGGMNVNVVNTSAKPVPTFAFPTEPFQIGVSFSIEAGNMWGYGSFIVPTGKRLVIEHVSSYSAMTTLDDKIINAAITTQQVLGGNEVSHIFVIVDQGRGPTTVHYCTVSQQMRLYAVEEVRFSVARSHFDHKASINFSVSGYLVDIT